MCGIAGLHHLHDARPISRETITRMIAALHHRGPDENGLYIDNRTGLGHARLSIIDLAGGSQPIHNETETLWIVYNGEVFNYPELRNELEQRGHKFYTTSDTEVILHLYEERGPDCVSELNGQFALAIWNSETGELFIARDRIGIRPLHYAIKDGTLYFASEAKAIFAAGVITPELDSIALDQVFTFWTTLPGQTMFKGVHELPPGHTLTVKHGDVSIRQYWDIPYCPPEERLDWSEDRIRDEIFDLLYDATRIRLRADVPVGTYLSGGLDSSGITALVSNHFNNQVKTFGIRFEDRDFDEGDEQQQMVRHLAADHHELVATNDAISRSFPEVIWFAEKPLVRTAPTPLYLLSQCVRENDRKVVLTGEGSDEVFGGYNIFRENKVRRFWAGNPDSSFRHLLLGRLYPYIFKDKRMAGMLKSFFGKGLTDTGDPLYSHLIRWGTTSRTKHLFADHIRDELSGVDAIDTLRSSLPAGFDTRDSFGKAQYLEMAIFLSNYLLSSQGDRVAMGHSLEIRLPYLDCRLIEFMANVPSKWKIRGLNEKYILKQVFRDMLPDTIVNRPKHPYRAPVRQGMLDEENRQRLTPDEITAGGLFHPGRVNMLLKKLENGKQPSETDSMALAGLLSGQVFAQRYLAAFDIDTGVLPPPTVVVDRTVPVP